MHHLWQLSELIPDLVIHEGGAGSVEEAASAPAPSDALLARIAALEQETIFQGLHGGASPRSSSSPSRRSPMVRQGTPRTPRSS